MKAAIANDINEYIAGFPATTQKKLEQIRSAIQKIAPAAEEAIKYAIPTFVLHGNLVHFAAYDHHIGFYPGAGAVASFKKELSAYKTAKGSIQFPLDKPIPLDLVKKIVKFRVKQNLEKAGKKKQENKKPQNVKQRM